jgi:signal transduction histidine kinase
MAKAKPHKPSEFEAVLLAISGHDLRQPLQVIQGAQKLLGCGARTSSELRLLQLVQNAIERLGDQLEELVAALQLREHAKEVKLTTVRVAPLLAQATYENKAAAQTKRPSVRTAPTSATIESDSLFLGTVLRNLISNAVKYTQPGGRILLGCRHTSPGVKLARYRPAASIL